MIDYKILSDADLVTLLRKGDHSAYTEIYRRYQYLIFIEAFRKLGDEDLAKDIVQELFVNFWIKRQTTTEVDSLAGYLLTAVKYRIFDFFDHQNVESKYIASLKDYANTGNIAHTDYLTREREWEKYIDLAIQALPQKMRQIFQLNKSDDLSYKEIAKKLNTTENNVQKHINGAIKILRKKLTLFIYITQFTKLLPIEAEPEVPILQLSSLYIISANHSATSLIIDSVLEEVMKSESVKKHVLEENVECQFVTSV